jgi:hypothetical protein
MSLQRWMNTLQSNATVRVSCRHVYVSPPTNRPFGSPELDKVAWRIADNEIQRQHFTGVTLQPGSQTHRAALSVWCFHRSCILNYHTMDFLKSAVASAMAKGPPFPYNFGDKQPLDPSIWTLHNGTRRVGTFPVAPCGHDDDVERAANPDVSLGRWLQLQHILL